MFQSVRYVVQSTRRIQKLLFCIECAVYFHAQYKQYRAGSKILHITTTPKPTLHIMPLINFKNRSCFLCYRYYRLWIYTCNAVLLMAVIVFCGVAGKVLLADYKRLLVNGLNLGQPSFIYAYLALLVQSGNYFSVGCRSGTVALSKRKLRSRRFPTTYRVSWCLKTIGEIVKRILAAVAGATDRRRYIRCLLDV